MATPINTEVMPGDLMTPATIDMAAWSIRQVGTQVSTQGGRVVTAWQQISGSYEAPEAQTLFASMNPVKTKAEAFGTDVGTVATALETFAEEVRTIKAAVAAIRADAASFLGGITGGKITRTDIVAHGEPYKHEVDWDSDQTTVDANNKLIHRTNDQQEALWAAERKCANAIYDVIGHTHVDAASDANCGQGYGVTDIPDNAKMPWGSSVERKEGCGEKVVKGVVVDGLGGMAEGLTSLVGISWSGPDGFGWSASTLGNTWKGVGMLAVGAVVNSLPGGQVLVQFMPGPVGTFLQSGSKALNQTVAGLVAIDPYAEDPFAKWKDDPWRAGGSSVFNIVTLFAAPTKIGNAGRAGRAGELAADAGRVGEGTGLAARAARAAETALSKVKTPTIEVLDRLFKKADLDNAIKVSTDVKVDVPSVGRHEVNTEHPNVGNHVNHDAPPARDVPDTPATHPSHTGDPTPGHSTDPNLGHSTADPNHPGSHTPGSNPTGNASTTPQLPKGLAHQGFEDTSHGYGSQTHGIDAQHPKVDLGKTSNEIGRNGEKLTAQDLKDRGYRVISEQAQIRYPDPAKAGTYKWFKPDFVAVDPQGKLVFVESKAGEGAKFTPNQLEAYKHYAQGTDRIVGRTANTDRALQDALRRAQVTDTRITRVEVYRWNVDITPSAALKARAGVP